MPVTETETALAKQIRDKSQQYITERRKSRDMKKHLTDLTSVVTQCLAAYDAEMCKPSTPDRSGRIAKISNALNLQNDIAKRFGLGITK